MTNNLRKIFDDFTNHFNRSILGSSILGTQATPTRILSEWLAVLGIFSEFWKPCVYLTHEGTSTFNCSQEEDVPTLLIIRKERVLIGGFMDRRSSSKAHGIMINTIVRCGGMVRLVVVGCVLVFLTPESQAELRQQQSNLIQSKAFEWLLLKSVYRSFVIQERRQEGNLDHPFNIPCWKKPEYPEINRDIQTLRSMTTFYTTCYACCLEFLDST